MQLQDSQLSAYLLSDPSFTKKWIRLDARGNKPGIHAACSSKTEKLAFIRRGPLVKGNMIRYM